jgi:hypothetical protein
MRKLQLPGRSEEMPRLDENDIEIVNQQGIEGLRDQISMFIDRFLCEGSEVPRRGNPVFKAMHACGVTDRKELERIHGVPRDVKMSQKRRSAVRNLLLRWIVREANFYRDERETVQANLQKF